MTANSCCCGKYNAREGSKFISVTAIVLAAISILYSIYQMIQIARAESHISPLLDQLKQLGELFNDTSGHDELRDILHNKKIAFGAAIGIGFVCLLVAIALFFATKKNTRQLALPYMIWTIIVQIALGILIALFVFYCAILDWSSKNSGDYIQIFVSPLISFIITFILNTWWLVVVFNFYKLLKSGQAFDSIPMQTA